MSVDVRLLGYFRLGDLHYLGTEFLTVEVTFKSWWPWSKERKHQWTACKEEGGWFWLDDGYEPSYKIKMRLYDLLKAARRQRVLNESINVTVALLRKLSGTEVSQ